ncbi:phage tail protein [Enterobacter asburiae]
MFDETGALIAVGNCPESYKPQLAEGSGRTQTVRMVLITSSTDNITLKIDPSVVLATRKYVDDKVLELKVYVDELMAAHLAATDPHSQYAPKASPTFTGIPKAPTAAAGSNTDQVATTGFVSVAIAALGEGRALPVGIPLPWPTATPPEGWLKCNGATFSSSQYPKLAQVYPSLKLPDLRGEFIRGWDAGRGVDSGRQLLSSQTDAMQPIIGSIGFGTNGMFTYADGAFTGINRESGDGVVTQATSIQQYKQVHLDSSLMTRTSSETRPRNISFNYIVRAA